MINKHRKGYATPLIIKKVQIKTTIKCHLTPAGVATVNAEARHQWLLSVILVTWVAEIRGSRFQASPDKQFMRLHLQNNQSKMDWR
jgi:hypothetical protein